jgi:cell wall-associated NlpC family hydrolase
MIDTGKYVGRKYEHNGRKDTLDCLGLVVSFLRDNGIYLPSNDGELIKKNWFEDNPNRLIEGLSRYSNRMNIEEIEPLDIVVFSFRGIPRHAGVMTDRSHFIHAREGKKVAVVRLKHYKRFLHSCWRVR